jgi:hypothetical protein
MYERAKVLRWWAIVTRERGEAAELTVFDLNKSGSRYACAVEEGAVLEGTRLLDAHVQPERCIGDLFRH